MDGPRGGCPPAATAAPSRAKLPLGIVFSTALFCGEGAAAAVLCRSYGHSDDRFWLALTVFFVLCPSVLVQLTLIFVHRDLSRDRPLVLLMHLLQLGPIIRAHRECSRRHGRATISVGLLSRRHAGSHTLGRAIPTELQKYRGLHRASSITGNKQGAGGVLVTTIHLQRRPGSLSSVPPAVERAAGPPQPALAHGGVAALTAPTTAV